MMYASWITLGHQFASTFEIFEFSIFSTKDDKPTSRKVRQGMEWMGLCEG